MTKKIRIVENVVPAIGLWICALVGVLNLPTLNKASLSTFNRAGLVSFITLGVCGLGLLIAGVTAYRGKEESRKIRMLFATELGIAALLGILFTFLVEISDINSAVQQVPSTLEVDVAGLLITSFWVVPKLLRYRSIPKVP